MARHQRAWAAAVLVAALAGVGVRQCAAVSEGEDEGVAAEGQLNADRSLNEWVRAPVLRLASNSLVQRYMHTAKRLGQDRLWVYGGLTSRAAVNDTEAALSGARCDPAHDSAESDEDFTCFLGGDAQVFDTSQRVWRLQAVSPPLPHCAFVGSETYRETDIYLYGGYCLGDADLRPFVSDALLLVRNGSAVSNVTVSGTAPPPRAGHSMTAYRDALVAYGGFDQGLQPTATLSLFNLSTSRWTVLDVQGPAPGPLHGIVLSHLAQSLVGAFQYEDEVLLVGGCTTLDDPYSAFLCHNAEPETWLLNVANQSWRAMHDPLSPSVVYAAHALDLESGEVQVSTGFGPDGYNADFFAFHVGPRRWSLEPELTRPTVRVGAAGVWLDTPGFAMFGGRAIFGVLDTLWGYDDEALDPWSRYTGADTSPEGRYGAAGTVLQPAAQRAAATRAPGAGAGTAGDAVMVVVGGYSLEHGGLRDVWSLARNPHSSSSNLVWTRVAVEGSLSTVLGHSLTTLGHTAIIYGGLRDLFAATPYGGIVVLTFASAGHTSEQLLNISGTLPPPRYGHTAVMRGSQMVVFGGVTRTSFANQRTLNDLWTIDFAAAPQQRRWTQLPHTSGSPRPAPRFGHVAGFFPEGDAMAVFSGFDAEADVPVAGAWAFSFSTGVWEPIGSNGPMPKARVFASGTSVGNNLVIAGGSQDNFFDNFLNLREFLDDTWSLAYHSEAEGAARWVFSLLRRDGLSMAAQVAVFGVAGIPTQLLSWSGFQFPRAEAGFLRAAATSLRVAELDVDLTPAAVHLFTPACPLGYTSRSYKQEPCRVCPLGFFTDTLGEEACEPCPADTTTSAPGASDVSLCDQCRPGICNDRGRCSIRASTPQCECNFGYSGSRCRVAWLLITLLSLFFGGGFLALIVWALRRYAKRVKHLNLGFELQEMLLSETQLEIQELERGWVVDAADVHIIQRLAEGGFGEVFLCRYQDRECAVKRLHKTMVHDSSESVAEFQQEIKFMRSLRHKNIVWFFGAGQQDGAPFILTEYMERGSLHQVLREEGLDLPWSLRLRFLCDAAEGMAFLHSLEPVRIHRDLKSGNLLINEAWTVKVADFGTSRLMSIGRGDARAGYSSAHLTQHIGTLLWTAPEILDGRDYGREIDVYSYAIVMWETATRRVPFEDIERIWDIRKAVIRGNRPALPATTPAGYAELMQACWAANPDHRPEFHSVVELARGLQAQEKGDVGEVGRIGTLEEHTL